MHFKWKDYLYFSKNERKAALSIVLIIGAVTIAAIFLQSKNEDDKYVTTKFDEELSDSVASLLQKENATIGDKKALVQNEITEDKLFVFDPNILDEKGWKNLGLNDKTIHTIINYRNKGGRFYNPEDIKKIYGLQNEYAEKLIPFIHIQSSDNKRSIGEKYANNTQSNNYTHKKYHAIDINKATEEEWKSLPGIGAVLSKRIVKFRESQNGFESIDDVAETYGLRDSVFQKIKPYLKISSTNN